MKYGYIRVSTSGQAKHGNSLEEQKKQLTAAGAVKIYQDVYTGAKSNRPELDKLLQEIQSGDQLIVTKLDRLSRSLADGASLIQQLTDREITVQILNIGTMDANSPTGKLLLHVLLAFAEFEREMIAERMQDGKAIARKKPGYHEGRPPIPAPQKDHAMRLLEEGYSYRETARITGLSLSTLVREARRRKAEK